MIIVGDAIQQPDSSLDWLLRLYMNTDRIKAGKQLQAIYPIALKWERGMPQIPNKPYTIRLPLSQIFKINESTYQFDADTVSLEVFPQKETGLLTYYAHCHFLTTMLEDVVSHIGQSNTEIFHTNHGVFYKRGDSHAWLFVNDYSWVGSLEKLRWPAIKQIIVYEDEYLILVTSESPTAGNSIYLINLENGYIGLIKAFEERIELQNISLENHQLNLVMKDWQEETEKQLSFEVQELLKELW